MAVCMAWPAEVSRLSTSVGHDSGGPFGSCAIAGVISPLHKQSDGGGGIRDCKLISPVARSCLESNAGIQCRTQPRTYRASSWSGLSPL